MSNGANEPPPESLESDVLNESAVDRALWAYLDASTAASQSALADAAMQSAAAQRELEEFLVADAELQQLVGALGPLAASMLRPDPTADRGADKPDEEIAELQLAPVAAAMPAEPRQPAAPARWLLIGGGGVLLAVLGGAVWLLQPPPAEPVHAFGQSVTPGVIDHGPRRPFAVSADLWKPPVATPGEWHYRLGETDAMARVEGLMPRSLRDAADSHPLTVLGAPQYGTGLAAGSTLAAELDPNDGYSGPVVTSAVDNFCCEAWFKLAAMGKSTVVYVGHGGQNGFGLLLHDNGHPGRVTYMGLYGGVQFLDTNIDVKVGEPVHLAVVRASQQTTVYLNGRPFSFGPVSPRPADGVMNIGGSAEFHGQIDEARVWVFPPNGFKPSDLLYPSVRPKAGP